MFCTKCGKQVQEGSVVCPYCGSPLAAPQAAPQPAPQAANNNIVGNIADKAKKGDKKLLYIVAAAAVAVVVIILILCLLLGNGPKSVVKNYLKKSEKLSEQQEKLDSKYLMFANKKALKKLDLWDDDDDEKIKTSWKVTKVKKYGKKDDVTEGVRAYVEKKDGDGDKVKSVAIVQVTLTAKIDGEKEKRDMYFTCAKIGGNWYLLSDDPSSGKNINAAAKEWESLVSKSSKKSSKDDD